MTIRDSGDRPLVDGVRLETPLTVLGDAGIADATGAAAFSDDIGNGSKRAHASSLKDFKSIFNGSNIQTRKKIQKYDLRMKWWQRLQQEMDALGWNKAELAKRSGVSYDSINKYLRGDTDNPRGNVIDKLADAVGKSRIWLRDGVELEPDADLAPSTAKWVTARKAGVVAAGLFREVDEFDQSEPEEITVPRDENFPNARQLVFTCEGDSMNELRPRPILPGDTLVCTAYEDIAGRVVLRDGMVVVVERSRDGGMMREWSVKQIEIYEDRTEFHPRSSNPKHKPIVVDRQFDADDGVAVEVIAIVRMVMNSMPGF